MEAAQYGFRFNPTDEENIEILRRKASGQEMPPLNFIKRINIYENEPQLLPWEETAVVGKDERYYYCKKENDSREVAGKGWWKATSHVKKVYVNGNVVGLKRPLTFHKYRDEHCSSRSNAIKTNWIMHEYSLHSFQTEWRLCKLKYKGKPSLQEEMETMRQTQCSSTHLQPPENSTDDNENAAELSSNEQQENQLTDVPYSAIQSHDDSIWPHFSPASAGFIDGSNHQYLEFDHIEEQFPALWSWQDWTSFI